MITINAVKFLATWLLFFLLLFGSNGSVLAVGTFGGTDLVNIPTAGVLPYGQYCFGVHFSESDYTKIQFDLGLVPDFEIGGVMDFWREDQDMTLRLKYRIIPEKRDSFGLALGVQDLGRETFTPYLVASQTLPQYGFRWHLGFGGGDLSGFFGGISKVFNAVTVSEGRRTTALPRVIVMGEFDSSGLNLATRIDLTSGLFLDLAIMDMEDFMIGVSFNSYL